MTRVQAGHRRDQGLCVFRLRVAQDVPGHAGLDDPAVAHHHDAVGDLRHHAEVVGDEHHCGAVLALQLLEQRKDLGLRGHVQRGGRLVGDDEGGLQRQRHRDHYPLALPSGKLVGIAVRDAFGIREVDVRKQLDDPLAPFLRTEVRVHAEDLVGLRAHLHQRVQSHHRFLEDHGDASAANVEHLLLAGLQEVPVLETDSAVDHAHVRRRQQAQD